MTQRKRVCRLSVWINPAFDARLAAEPDIDLAIGDLKGGDAAIWQMLSRTHVYHASPARNELPKQWHVDAALLAKCPELLLISSAGAGHDTIDVAACTRAGIAVVNQIGANALSVAEHAVGLMLAVARKIPVSDRRLRTERGFSRESLMGREISGAALGIIGLGQTGSRTATIARGFGMKVLAHDPLLSRETIAARGAEAVDLPTLLAKADIVSLHTPLDATTRNLMDARAFAQMKRGAIFVSTARGGIHDEAALTEALTSGHLGGAGLDVWEAEPPPLDHPLLKLDNVVATYHTAGVTHEARRNVAAWAADQIVDVMAGRPPARLVNPDVWPVFETRLARTLKA